MIKKQHHREFRNEVINVRVEVSQLKLGMFVSKLDRPWEEVPALMQGFTIRNPDQIKRIEAYCDHVYVDKTKTIPIERLKFTPSSAGTATILNAKGRNEGKKKSLFTRRSSRKKDIWKKIHSISKRDLVPAERDYKEAFKLVKSTMQNIRLGRSIDTPAAKEAVSACVDNILHRPNAMLLMSRLRSKDEYTSEHSLNVSIISIALARYVGLNRNQLNEVGLCGLLHDMGKMLTPEQILNKPGHLTGEELQVMRQHPADGQDILSSTAGMLHEAIHVAHAHHERVNGQGYPLGLPGGELSTYNKIVTIADVFDAITGDRIYRQGETVETALQIMHNNKGKAFDPILVTQFIENIGIYPLGTVVELHNGEIGVVVHTTPDKRLRPWVKIILDQTCQPVEPHLINLAEPNADADGNPYWIKASHNPRNFDIDLLKHVHGQLD